MSEKIPVFVYGTLRVGESNYRWASEAVSESVQGVVAEGRIYFAYTRGSYPVAKFDEPGSIIGDVLWFDPEHDTFADVVGMELGAGYTVREIEVTHEGETIECIAFHYVRTPRGDLIENGDWVNA